MVAITDHGCSVTDDGMNNSTNSSNTDNHQSEIRKQLAHYRPEDLSVTQGATLLVPMRQAFLAATPRNEEAAQT